MKLEHSQIFQGITVLYTHWLKLGKLTSEQHALLIRTLRIQGPENSNLLLSKFLQENAIRRTT